MVKLSGYLIASIIILFAGCPHCEACEAEPEQAPASAAAESEKTGKPGVYYKPVPHELEKQITENLATLAKDLPVSAQDSDVVRDTISQLDWKWTHRNKAAREALRRVDAAAIPVINEFLASKEETDRRKGIVALRYMMKPKECLDDYRSVAEKTLIRLFRRSALDKDLEVRREASGALYRMGMARYRTIPDEIKIGLEQVAESDPDPRLRDLARQGLENLGLAPHSCESSIISD